MKHKVAELEGALLDAAVAKAEDVILVWENFERLDYSAINELDGRYYKPSTDWRVGGRIISWHRIGVESSSEGEWAAMLADQGHSAKFGPTPLIAAMRAFVVSKLGDEVELPWLGENRFASLLLPMLGFQGRDEIPRYRDCWWNGQHIVVLTRTGGGNRPEYMEEIARLQGMPEYVSDADDDYDCTYAIFKFKLPTQYEHFRDALESDTRSLRERWENYAEISI